VTAKLAEREAQARANGDADLRRSTMSPAEKSRYIRKYTKAKYDELPW
jgi:hypothetical protein